jgi:hypothetical protein
MDSVFEEEVVRPTEFIAGNRSDAFYSSEGLGWAVIKLFYYTVTERIA